jgi:sodium-dependent dicarboxylate transporter 2/3/5
MATLVGTPPNLIFASRFHAEFPGAPEISFARWLVLGVPFSAVFLACAWALLVYWLHPLPGGSMLGGRRSIARELEGLGAITPAEKRVLAVFLCVCFLWVFRADIPLDLRWGPLAISKIPGWSELVGLAGAQTRWVSDGTVAMMAAVAMFLIPSGRGKGERLVDRKIIEDLPWNVLFLFGGGFALSDGFTISGLSAYIGRQLEAVGTLPVPAQILGVVGTVMFLTELTSNTAVANMAMPLLAAMARAIPVNPIVLMLPGAISASCAFMLPVATPPNAIVFGTGLIPMRAMIRAGLLLNLVGVILVLLLVYFVAIPLWGIDPRQLPPSWLRAGA